MQHIRGQDNVEGMRRETLHDGILLDIEYSRGKTGMVAKLCFCLLGEERRDVSENELGSQLFQIRQHERRRTASAAANFQNA